MNLRDLTHAFRKHNAAPATEDFGLGDQIGKQGGRLINRDGSFNVQRRGIHNWSPYENLVEMSWPLFLGIILCFYIVTNAIFGLLFVLIGTDSLTGGRELGGFVAQFAYSFYFSVQTFTTVGYGAISPVGDAANLLASLAALVGLLSAALATGLVFARFSQPKARIRFSEYAVVAPYRDTPWQSLQFRIANIRSNRVINLKASIVLTWLDGPEGQRTRRFAPLQLERDRVALFPLNWTIVHVIDEESPLYEWNYQRICELSVEMLIMIEGFDETFAQTIHANNSYTCREIYWNARFLPMYHSAAGTTVLELDHIDDLEVMAPPAEEEE
jgi:inward rectifier potassium channel